jgi:hypothetical protein
VSLRARRKEECEELCRRRVELESLLGVKGTDFEKCLRICRVFASP